ncbi:cupin domain-containing protein [Actinacidiphila sp. ITFR-21]|uniref:cupin domain-containing protein n=1 Tax=Actinacidiphila sp. ITFR-21 TaxID=3075199 RepID=UPI0028897FC6|nr:cupin domain-containing protein [Streptomyces sp. ITFR-21]WNI18739.1 cupin domain-containing protein [Streptomyces sp. ITFR-21]
MTDKAAKRTATIRQGAEVLWEQPPNHFDALSKMLVRPENSDSVLFDFRISTYQPKGYVAPHVHRAQEQIYYILEGEGLMELEGERTVVAPWTVVHIPPGVEHAIYNTGMIDLKFVVVTTPPEDGPPE